MKTLKIVVAIIVFLALLVFFVILPAITGFQGGHV